MKATTLTAFVFLLAISACGGPERELDALFQAEKYEEFMAKVREVDPRNENKAHDAKRLVAARHARISRCKRESESILATLADLDIKGNYAEI
jgi:hypothetical protein